MTADEVLVEHLRRAFIGTFGDAGFEVWLGKDGLRRHGADEVATAMVSALAPLLEDPGVRDRIGALHAAGLLAPAVADPGPPS